MRSPCSCNINVAVRPKGGILSRTVNFVWWEIVDELAANFLRFNPCLLPGVVLLTFWPYFIETATTSSKGSAIGSCCVVFFLPERNYIVPHLVLKIRTFSPQKHGDRWSCQVYIFNLNARSFLNSLGRIEIVDFQSFKIKNVVLFFFFLWG